MKKPGTNGLRARGSSSGDDWNLQICLWGSVKFGVALSFLGAVLTLSMRIELILISSRIYLKIVGARLSYFYAACKESEDDAECAECDVLLHFKPLGVLVC